MVSATDYPHGSRAPYEHKVPRKPRFRFFAALAAPFKDMDERAVQKKHGAVEARNNKGNMFAPRSTAPVQVPVRRFARSDD